MEGSPNKSFISVVGESGEVIYFCSFNTENITAEEVLIFVCQELGFDINIMCLQWPNRERNPLGLLMEDSIIPLKTILVEGLEVQIVNVKGNEKARSIMYSEPNQQYSFSPKDVNGNPQKPTHYKIKERSFGVFEKEVINSENTNNNNTPLKSAVTEEKADFVTIVGTLAFVGKDFEHIYVFPKGVKSMNLDMVLRKVCHILDYDHNIASLTGSLEPNICHSGERLFLILRPEQKRNKQDEYLKVPIFVRVSKEPLMFVGIPVSNKGKSYLRVLDEVCKIQNVSSERRKLVLLKDEILTAPPNLHSGAKLCLIGKD